MSDKSYWLLVIEELMADGTALNALLLVIGYWLLVIGWQTAADSRTEDDRAVGLEKAEIGALKRWLSDDG